MAKTKATDPCERCSGGRIFPHYKHVDSGVCFRCRGSGIDPGRDSSRKYTPRPEKRRKKRPHLSPAQSREEAVTAMKSVAYHFSYIEGGRWQEEGFEGLDEAYSNLGYHLARAVFDLSVFNRAVERARSRIPFQYRLSFESGLAEGIRQVQDDYEGIVWVAG